MKLLIGLTFILVFNSCSEDARLEKYNKIIDACDKVRVYKKLVGNDFELVKEIVGKKELLILKQILKSGINPEIRMKFVADKRFEIFKGNKVVGYILTNGSKERPFANFVNDEFGFGFRLPYRIGMYPD